MPGANQAEHLAAERSHEQPVHFIQTPKQRLIQLGKDISAQISLEIGVWTRRGSHVLVGFVSIELVGDGFGHRAIQSVHGFEVFRVKFLQVRRDGLRALFPGELHASSQQ